jgi:hypothetical protein
MKKTCFIFVVLMFLFAVYGCKRTDNDVTDKIPKAEMISPKIASLLKITSVPDQKLAYETLDSNEKATVWKTHIGDVINSGTYNTEQNKLLGKLQNKIQPTFFNGSANQSKLKPFEEAWMAEAKKIFSSDDLKILFLTYLYLLIKQRLKYKMLLFRLQQGLEIVLVLQIAITVAVVKVVGTTISVLQNTPADFYGGLYVMEYALLA